LAQSKFLVISILYKAGTTVSRPQWPPVLSCGSACGLLLAGIAVSNPAGSWMYVACECCVLQGRDLCDGPIRYLVQSSSTECVCVLLNVTRCNNNRLHLQRVGRRVPTKKGTTLPSQVFCLFLQFYSSMTAYGKFLPHFNRHCVI
jgi:hypothetical protein